MSKKSVAPMLGAGMVSREVRIRAPDVVFLKGIVEASEGLAAVFAERGGDITIASPADREAELDLLVDDLCRELGALRVTRPVDPSEVT
jgi:hypothetical protein